MPDFVQRGDAPTPAKKRRTRHWKATALDAQAKYDRLEKLAFYAVAGGIVLSFLVCWLVHL